MTTRNPKSASAKDIKIKPGHRTLHGVQASLAWERAKSLPLEARQKQNRTDKR